MTEWAVVTGGSRGIGAAVCQRMHEANVKVLLLDRLEPEHDVYDEFLQVDLFKPVEAAELLKETLGDRVVTRFLHNAGMCVPATLENATVAGIEKEIAVNTLSLISLAQVVLPSMKEAGKGRIVAIGSRAALGKPERTGYAAAKAALSGLVRTWTYELGPLGITANVVAPGATRTTMLRDHNEPDGWFMRDLAAKIPVGFVADPIDIANAVAFLASDEARFITGQVLHVCGGMSVGFISR